ncbi:redoxin domain-containing protein [Flavobacteriales bacterium]|jgi:thioredoxin-related protein|nr:redoxin domain-containing protein [Flavobacteriales bacterium]
MKTPYTIQTTFLLVVFTLICNSSIAQKNSPLELGAIIPMSEELMINVTDEKMSLNSNFNENGLLVVFSCNTCPFVVMWEDRYRQLEKMCQINNVGMVYINSNEAKRDGDDSAEAMKNHAKSMGYTFPYLIDQNSAVANAFGAKTTPHIYLFDKNKTLVYKGAIDDNFRDISQVKETYLLDAIEQMVEGVDIKLKETNAKGCSIKREIN